jgi:hypothetical protein
MNASEGRNIIYYATALVFVLSEGYTSVTNVSDFKAK